MQQVVLSRSWTERRAERDGDSKRERDVNLIARGLMSRTKQRLFSLSSIRRLIVLPEKEAGTTHNVTKSPREIYTSGGLDKRRAERRDRIGGGETQK